MGCPMAGSVAVNGPSSMIAACKERQPASWLFAISRFPARNTRPCVSSTVKTVLGETISIILSCEHNTPQRLFMTRLTPSDSEAMQKISSSVNALHQMR